MKNKVPYFFLALAAVLAAAAVVLWTTKRKPSNHHETSPKNVPTSENSAEDINTPKIDDLNQPLPTQTPEQILENLGVGLATADPSELLNQISEALNKGDMNEVSKLIGKDAMNAKTFALLNAFAKQPHIFREVGEIELNQRTLGSRKLPKAILKNSKSISISNKTTVNG